jgi:CHAT domain-containing protein
VVQAQGQDSVSLSHAAQERLHQHDVAGAVDLSRKALAAARREHPAGHEEIATSLWNLARMIESQGGYAEMKPLLRESLGIYEKTYGPDHVYVAEVLGALARAHAGTGDTPAAVSSMERALSILEKAKSEKHADYLVTLAAIHEAAGDYRRAQTAMERSIAVHAQRHGPDDPGLIDKVVRLGAYRYQLGDLRGALRHYARGLRLVEKRYGKDHIHSAMALQNMAVAYHELGDYVRAEQLYLKSLALKEKYVGDGHPDTAITLANIAQHYLSRGDPARARPYAERAVASYEAASPQSHGMAVALHRIGEVRDRLAEDAGAEQAHLRALAINEAIFPKDHVEVAGSLTHLTHFYLRHNQHAKALPLGERALAIFEVKLPPGNTRIASALELVAHARNDRTSLDLYRRVLAMREAAVGKNHPDVATSLVNIVLTLMEEGRRQEAIALQERNNAIREQHLVTLLGSGSDAQKQQTISNLTRDLDTTLTLHLDAPNDKRAARLAFTTLAQRKGRELDAVSAGYQNLRRSLSPDDHRLLDELSRTRAHIAAELGSAASSAATREKLSARAEELEARISARSAAFRRRQPVITFDTLRAAVPSDAAVVELVVYQPRAWNSPSWKCAPLHYAAYVLVRGKEPQGVDLGEAKPIDELVATLRRQLANPRADPRATAQALHRRVMAPLVPLLGSLRHVLVSPDGALNLVPFAALSDERGRYLVERYSFSYLTSVRDLIDGDAGERARGGTVVVADPDFGAIAAPGDTGARSGALGIAFDPLPASGQEASALALLLGKATTLRGTRATEEAIKRLRGPRILHIATHGFFLPEIDSDVANPCTRAAKLVRLEPTPQSDPMLASGLAFARANERGRAGRDGDDGVLTALEATSLDLSGTKLVVLSACQTGVGEVRNGQGVFGLRRALAIAGAETQVMSLWKVDDDATRDLMVHFYRGLRGGEARSEAMRKVQLAMLRRQSTAHPYYWSAFIVSGRDGPLGVEDRRSLGRPGEVAPSARGCACELTGAGDQPGALALVLCGAWLAALRHRRRRAARKASAAIQAA